MDELVTAILGFLKQVAERSGMKSIVAMAFGYGIMQLTLADKVPGLYALLAMVVICVGFFVFRDRETVMQSRDGWGPKTINKLEVKK